MQSSSVMRVGLVLSQLIVQNLDACAKEDHFGEEKKRTFPFKKRDRLKRNYSLGSHKWTQRVKVVCQMR